MQQHATLYICDTSTCYFVYMWHLTCYFINMTHQHATLLSQHKSKELERFRAERTFHPLHSFSDAEMRYIVIKRFEDFELINKRIGLKFAFCCSLWHGHSTGATDSFHAPLICVILYCILEGRSCISYHTLPSNLYNISAMG